jgi:long-chain acyl-CoA synthetase
MAVAVDFSTIPEMFDRITTKYAVGGRPVLMHKVDKQYRSISYSDLRRRVELFSLGLSSIGVMKDDKIAIISENRPEWVVADLSIVTLGAVDVPIYPTLTPPQIAYILNDAAVKVVIVSNALQLNKVLKVRSELKALQHIVLMNEKVEPKAENTSTYAEVINLGEAYERLHPALFRELLVQVRPENLLTIIYTSGTTGNPKGVMLTHQNLVSNIKAAAEVLPLSETDTLLSFLPLCHSFERMAGYYTAMACGSTVAYAESTETVSDNLLEIHPTVVTTVPRLFERIYGRMMKQIDSSPPARQRIFRWAVSVGKEFAHGVRAGSVSPALRIQQALADRLVFSKLKQKTGGQIRFFVSGGAALAKELGEFFEAVGIVIIEGYGLTETAPVLTANRLDDFKYGTVGKPLPGVDIKIADDGEILAKGPNIMRGYFNNAEATAEVIDKDGWFHTGDVGMFDLQGHLMITDRKKHLFVSSGGKNIAPQPIESLFLQSKYIDQVVLVGDGRMFLTALIVPEFDRLREYAVRHGISYSISSDLVLSHEVRKLFEKEIQHLQKDLPTYERVRRFELLAEPLTMENGEITPTLKVKRKVVEKKYADLIEKMYQNVA